MRKKSLFLGLFVFLGCPRRAEKHEDPTGIVTDLVVDAATPEAPPPPPPCIPSDAGVELSQKPCAKNDDCVLTDVPVDCNACNLASLYPASKRAVAERNARCAKQITCPPRVCPTPDTLTPVFYRAECRQSTCIAFRWHSGG